MDLAMVVAVVVFFFGFVINLSNIADFLFSPRPVIYVLVIFLMFFPTPLPKVPFIKGCPDGCPRDAAFFAKMHH
jgi:hypothetical protein